MGISGQPITWETLFEAEQKEPYFKRLLTYLDQAQSAGKQIYPAQRDRFRAFKLTPFDAVKVVIIGQDPYHGPHQAHGLSFSVPHGVPKPPSLKNIFKALQIDLGIPMPEHGCLDGWAHQGVLLLNAVLTVEAGKPQSHALIGWEQFTNQVIASLNTEKEGVIFLLWGASAQKKASMIDPKRHYLLQTVHPSPLSAYRGFFQCHHFSATNDLLGQMGKPPIAWERL